MRFAIALSTLFLVSCTNDSAVSHLKPMNLLKYDVPLTILAPDSAQVQTLDLVVQKDISIKAGDDFYIQMFASDATSFKSASVLSKLKTEIQEGRYFSKFVQEDEDGFIFEMAIDSLKPNYDFRHVKLQGDREYEFRTGLVGSFTLEQVKVMYEAVQSK